MNSAIEELVRSLLYEGYALYPYTPGVKNATPDPVRDRLPAAPTPRPSPPRSRCSGSRPCSRAVPTPGSPGTVLFLQATGERHEAGERSLELGPVTLAELARRTGARDLRLSDGGGA